MLPLILLTASLLPAQQASMECDHSKNSHDCNADYQLLVTPAQGGFPVTVDLTSSDADYGRSLSLRLDGFSEDGKRVFGILAEGGKYRATLLFDYHMADGTMQNR